MPGAGTAGPPGNYLAPLGDILGQHLLIFVIDIINLIFAKETGFWRPDFSRGKFSINRDLQNTDIAIQSLNSFPKIL